MGRRIGSGKRLSVSEKRERERKQLAVTGLYPAAVLRREDLD